MSDKNRGIVKEANALLADGKTEGFLLLCAEDVEWTLLGDSPTTMNGREAMRKFMASSTEEGSEPPVGHARAGVGFVDFFKPSKTVIYL